MTGFYCETDGLTNVTNPCQAGSYCPTGSHNPTPHTCDFGFHCPTGSPQPQPCIAGYYTNATGQSVCQKCPIGMYCLPLTWRQGIPQNESVTYKPCPRGFYCPEQTGSNYIPCPAGTYSNETGLYDVMQCKSCDPGQYCSGDLRTKTDGPCAAGYYCKIGKSLSNCYFYPNRYSNYIEEDVFVDTVKVSGKNVFRQE